MSLFLTGERDSCVTGISNGVDELLASISSHLKQGDKVQLIGFGIFEVRERSARTGVKPGTTEKIEIPASKYPAFKAGKNLKDELMSDSNDGKLNLL